MQRRFYLLLLILLVGTTALASAQESPPEEEDPVAEPILIERGPDAPPLFGPLQEEWQPVELEPVAPPSMEPVLTLGHAADLCSQATPLALFNGTSGDLSFVNEMSVSPDDPVLGCMLGAPQSAQGYRTVWYRFEPAVAGFLTVFTGFNPSDYSDSYDTVLSLYKSADGTCDSLQQVACDDDTSGFFSKIRTFVDQGEVYYLEVADWQFSVQSAATLRLSIVLEEADSFWEQDEGMRLPQPRSRHMVVTDGRYFYILGGETVIEPFPERNHFVIRYDPLTKTYEPLVPMPAPAYPGYSRTSAAYLNGNIYIPSGFVGNTTLYDGTHWVYNIPSGTWFISTPVPWDRVRDVDGETVSPTGQPYAWAEAAAAPINRGYFLTGGLASGDPDPTFPADAQPVGRLLFFQPAEDGRSGFWNTNFPDMPTPRYAHTSAVLEGPQGRLVCVTGGIGKVSEDQAAVLRSTECYNTVSGSWQTLAPLNFARFAPGSAVGPDGRWYVFGGINAQLQPVLVTEVYDPATNTWTALDSRFYLDMPGRAWPRGAFIGDELWVFGGEVWSGQGADIDALTLIEALDRPQQTLLPFMRRDSAIPGEPNDTFAEAEYLPLNQTGTGDFSGQDDFFDFYRFDVPEGGSVIATVSSIPAGHDYDIYLYSANKYPVGQGTAPGQQDDTAITFPLLPGTYYAMVVRAFGEPTNDTYHITVRPIE